jgi:hypothetical protein
MTDEQKYFFDVKGWLLLPAVLSEAECTGVREHVRAGGTGFTGPAQALADHPAVADVLNDLLSNRELAEDYYNFRCEGCFTTIRACGWKPGATERPHRVIPPQFASEVRYQCEGGMIYSGLTRVVWEINPVRKGAGGTLFLSGSHKAKFSDPPSVIQPDSPHLESYECPAGSAFIFTESLLHAATAWTDPETDRMALFYAYNSVWAQWHRLNLPHEVIETMPPKRRSLFRGVYAHDFTARPHELGDNRYYSLENRTL